MKMRCFFSSAAASLLLTGSYASAQVAGLSFAVQPGGATSGLTFSQPPVIQTVDQFGTPTTVGLPPTLMITIGLTSGSGALFGTTNYNIGTTGSNGVVTCADLGVTGTGNGMALTVFAPPGYGPLPVTGESIWLDASVTSSVTVAGGNVTAWADQSGNGNNFAQFGTGTAPTYVNTVADGRMAVTFNAGMELANSTYVNTNTDTISVFVVNKKTASGQGGGTFARTVATYCPGCTGGDGTDHDYYVMGSFEMDFGAGDLTPRFTRDNNSPGGFAYDPSTAYHADEFISSGTVDQCWTTTPTSAGNSGGTVTQGGTYGITTIAIGGGLNKVNGVATEAYGLLAGDICELLVYNSALSAPQRGQVETYLQNKWMTNAYPLAYALTNATSASFNVSSGSAPQSITFQLASQVPDGQTAQATVLANFTTQTNNVTSLATYQSGNTSIATVSGSGLVTGQGLGSTYIVASYDGFQATNNIQVTVPANAPVTGLAFTTEPGSASAGTPFGQQPVLKTVNQFGVPTTVGLPASLPVTISLISSSGALIGTTSYDIGTNSDDGVIDFTGLGVTAAGSGDQLVASVGASAPLAGAAIWLDANNTNSVTAPGGVVSGWNNLGSLGGTLGVATDFGPWTGPAWVPNSLNGLPVVSFVSTSTSQNSPGNVLTNSWAGLDSGADLTVFTVIRQPANPINNWGGFIGFGNSLAAAGKVDSSLGEDCDEAAGGFRFFRNDARNSPAANVGENAASGLASAGNGGGGWYNKRPGNGVGFVNTFYYYGELNGGNGAGADYWAAADGSTWTNYEASSYNYGNFNVTDFGLGCQLGINGGSPLDGPDWPMSMDFAEVLVYTSTLTDANRAAVTSYLSAKWFTGGVSNAVSTPFNVGTGSGSQTNNIISIVKNGGGTLTLTFAGTPGITYSVEATASLRSPVVWTPLTDSTNTVGGGGTWTYQATPGGSPQFYRSVVSQ